MAMKRVKLTKEEQQVENALLQGELQDVKRREFTEIAQAVAARKKDAILHIRVNSEDLRSLKRQAKRLGVRYQTFVAEVLHRVAHR
jgi:predicted DNA binding CopG/RHH family protein